MINDVGLGSAPQGLSAKVPSARGIYAFRRQRDKLFDCSLFGEPAWDMLLDLYEAGLSDQPICITSACIASATPPTTALRWINILIASGYVERYPDQADGRRSYVRLTRFARTKMDILFNG